jgi:hypothetical protein
VTGESDPVWLRALSWVESQKQAFSIPEAPPEACSLAHVKAVGELARAASVLLQQPSLPAEIRTRTALLLDHAWTTFQEGELFAEILTGRPDLLMLGSLYSIFDRHGRVHERTRSILERLPEQPQIARPRHSLDPRGRARLGADAPAVLALGLAEAWRCLGLASRWSAERLFPRTLLARRGEGAISREAAYSIAHTVFFMTDFGSRPWALDARSRDYLREAGPPWMAAFLAIPDYDVFSELAFALTCSDCRDRDADVEAALQGAQEPGGAVPGPAVSDVDSETPLTPPAFRRDYHTTLVALLASFGATVGIAPAPPQRAFAKRE